MGPTWARPRVFFALGRHLGLKLASCWHYFPLLGRFWALLERMLHFLYYFLAICSDFWTDFYWLWEDLGMVLGMFFHGFLMLSMKIESFKK